MPGETLDSYVRNRARELGISLAELSRRAGMSRQTVHALGKANAKMPNLGTVVTLAGVLEVHPMRLLHLMFDASPMPPRVRSSNAADRSAFVRDVSHADGELVLPGERFTKTWELQNVGTVPWEGRFLDCQDEDLLVYQRSGATLHLAANLMPTHSRVPVPTTPPGEKVEISVQFTAPATPGTVLSYWKMVFADGSFCFPPARGVWVKVRISTLARAAVCASPLA
jgi:DNA-binding Xre family transcriptional regulator